MRMMCGLMGVAVVPMAFYTIKNSGHSLHASILAAVLVLFGRSGDKSSEMNLEPTKRMHTVKFAKYNGTMFSL
jgi:dolichyl-phosphate-mannose--protein O-mannosyl transferase